MDMVLIILVIAIIAVGLFFKDFKSVVYFLGIIEIFFRLIHRLANILGIKEFTLFITKYIPYSLENVINTYSSGLLNTVFFIPISIAFSFIIFTKFSSLPPTKTLITIAASFPLLNINPYIKSLNVIFSFNSI